MMIPFILPTLTAIENEILKEKSAVQNFPKVIDFPFSENYKTLVTQIKTSEISSETILYNSVDAVNENKEFNLPEYWCFAGNGQGDRWFLDRDQKVFFYDYDDEGKLKPMHINFEEWLQMTFIIHQLDDCFDQYDHITEPVRQEFYKALNTIHPTLSDMYPFTL
ncbi:hypothetical protein [Chryseobacterium sp. AG363]|uniref:hypothetical protein n=1 Tax=Chryseobacterium sp. AG363 TaxID=2183997 RepID=UPI000E76C2B6|nr:hypothetical protein [Chryseobacterium sp. AG363]